jgi:hypothetical protein
MKSNESANPKWASWEGPVALLTVAGAVGLWLWQTQGDYVPLWPAVGLLALTAALGAVWLYRGRAARRFLAVLDAYAEQELTRAGGGRRSPRITVSAEK